MRDMMLIGALSTLLILTACDEPSGGATQSAAPSVQPEMMLMAADASPRSGIGATIAKSGPNSSPRMEIGRDYSIEITNGGVEDAMQADRTACLKLKCVITAVNSSNLDEHPTAMLRALVPLDSTDAFHQHLMNGPDRVIASFNEMAQNREDQHQNIKARVERLEFMKKRLYTLADQKSDQVGELLQVERELLRVDTELERLTRERKGLEKVTDNMTFTMIYAERPPKAGGVDFSPFTRLLSDMANTLIWGTRTTLVWVARWTPAAILVLAVVMILRRRKQANAAQDHNEA